MSNDLAPFESIRFEDRAGAESRLAAILDGTSDLLSESLAAAFAEAADASRVLVRLERFLDSAGAPDATLNAMADSPDLARMACSIFDHSLFLTDILCKHPEYLDWLWNETDLNHPLEKNALLIEVRALVAEADSVTQSHAVLRRIHRREILRIGVRDVYCYASVPSVTEDLSNLADVMAEAALDIASEAMRARYGSPRVVAQNGETSEATFVVLGMGKLGGRELNFSSDIDLIFVFSDDGETTGGTSKPIHNTEFFHRLGEQLIKALADQTAEGQVFRVDMRLRPYGRMASLATSLNGCLNYYEMQGRPWERQALIKVRPIAGDLALGERLIELTRPFVFPKYFDDSTLEDIRETKRMAEAQTAEKGQTENEVKLGRGGIRDIEFTVQMLQLLNGGRQPKLRSTNTLDAIEILGEEGLLTAFEALTLSRNYVFLRQVEHRLQIEGSQQRHALPTDPHDLDDFGRRLGYQSGDAFMVGYRDRSVETRRILDRFFDTKGSGDLWVTELLNPNAESEHGLDKLQGLGFVNPKSARDELARLANGDSGRPHSAHVRRTFRTVAPLLIEAVSAAPSPDATLVRLGQVIANIQAPGAIYEILVNDTSLCGSLVTLVSNSHYLADLIIRDPGLFDTFGQGQRLVDELTQEQVEEDLSFLKSAHDSSGALYRMRNAQTLRIGMRELLQGVDVVTVGRELTLVADLCVRDVLETAREKTAERYGPTEGGFVVLGLGKQGGREMGYGSDLDLIFVYDSEAESTDTVAAVERFSALAAHMIKAIKGLTQFGMLYDIDARLRPDGSKGALVVSSDRLSEYYSNEAQGWERMALLKARAVAGNDPFRARIEEEAHELAYSTPFTHEDFVQAEKIRKQLSAKASPLDIKKAEGGIAELEFAIRFLQLHYGKEDRKLRTASVLEALPALHNAELLSAEDKTALHDTYLLFRRVENRIRMMDGKGGSALPKDKAQQQELAARLNIQADLGELIATQKEKIHKFYEATLAKVLDLS